MRIQEVGATDVSRLVAARNADGGAPADPRMRAYLEGRHHPRQALGPRVIFAAAEDDAVIGYIGGHLTERYGCDGELQYLWVAAGERRRGIAVSMFRELADWFTARQASRVCVDVEPENAVARAFYASRGARRLKPYWMVWDDIGHASGSPSPSGALEPPEGGARGG